MKIVIVEDQEATADSLKARLEEERYAVDVEHDGERDYTGHPPTITTSSFSTISSRARPALIFAANCATIT